MRRQYEAKPKIALEVCLVLIWQALRSSADPHPWCQLCDSFSMLYIPPVGLHSLLRKSGEPKGMKGCYCLVFCRQDRSFMCVCPV